MNKTNFKNKLARNYKQPSTASYHNTQQTQKLEEENDKHEREISASLTSGILSFKNIATHLLILLQICLLCAAGVLGQRIF